MAGSLAELKRELRPLLLAHEAFQGRADEATFPLGSDSAALLGELCAQDGGRGLGFLRCDDGEVPSRVRVQPSRSFLSDIPPARTRGSSPTGAALQKLLRS